jgi:hypothetical protein
VLKNGCDGLAGGKASREQQAAMMGACVCARGAQAPPRTPLLRCFLCPGGPHAAQQSSPCSGPTSLLGYEHPWALDPPLPFSPLVCRSSVLPPPDLVWVEQNFSRTANTLSESRQCYTLKTLPLISLLQTYATFQPCNSIHSCSARSSIFL